MRTRAAPPRNPRSRRRKYGSSSAPRRRDARRRSTVAATIPSTKRGTTTTASIVAAIRCSQRAAFSLAGARIDATCATSGTARPGDPRARRQRHREQRAHLRGIEERALPARPVLEREPAHVHARDDAERERGRGEVQDARRARRIERRRRARPRRRGLGVARAACAAPCRARPAREARERRAQRQRRRGRVCVPADERRRGQHQVDGEVPYEEQEDRRSEQVDRLRPADAIHGDADARARRRPPHCRSTAASAGCAPHGTNGASRRPMRSSASAARRATNCAGGACWPTTSAAARLAHARSVSDQFSRACASVSKIRTAITSSALRSSIAARFYQPARAGARTAVSAAAA